MNNCKFDKSWIGKCNKETENTYCEEHSKMKCGICGEQATHDCYETGFLVCGYPLCDSKFCKALHYIRSHNFNIDDYKDKLSPEEIKAINIIRKVDKEYRELFVKYIDLLDITKHHIKE
jgi:hypothetical protein